MPADPEPSSLAALTPQQKAHLYLCLVPFFGFVPAALNLARDRQPQALRDASQVAVVLALAWIALHHAAGSGVPGDAEAIGRGLVQGTLGSLYFAGNFWLMVRAYRNKPIAFPWSGQRRKR